MSDTQTAFDPAAAAPFLVSRAHNGWLGLRFSDHGEDWVEMELPWREDLLGEEGRDVLASGPIWARMGEFRAIATLDLRVDYTRPARERASVFGRVQCYRTTRSAAFVRGIAHDGDPDDPVAHMQAVFMTIDKRTIDLPKEKSGEKAHG